MTDERNRWLDIVKGLTIFLMILGHCIQNGNGAAYISSQAFWSDKVYNIYLFFPYAAFYVN